MDNLTAEYLDPIMAPVIDELMSALWDHLKPTPYSHFHSHTTMRILGKLGAAETVRFLHGPPELSVSAISQMRRVRLISDLWARAKIDVFQRNSGLISL